MDGVLLDKSGTTLIQCPVGRTGVTIPSSVTSIGDNTFTDCERLTRITIPNSVASIGPMAFFGCRSLKSVYFQGDAPAVFRESFANDPKAIVYYLPGATGWGATFGDRPAVLWNLAIQTNDAHFGAKAGAFGFNVTGTIGLSFVVEEASDLAQPIWSPVISDTLVGGTAYFSDPQWVNYPSRVYRIRPQ